MCADPNFDMKDSIRDNIARNGRQIVGVFPDETSGRRDRPVVNAAFLYTVGNSVKGVPELLLIGMYDEHGASMLNWLSEEMIKRGKKFDDGERVDLGGDYPVLIIDARLAVKEEYTRSASMFFGENNYTVQQVILCDPQGRFPGEPGCAKPYNDVVVWREGRAS